MLSSCSRNLRFRSSYMIVLFFAFFVSLAYPPIKNGVWQSTTTQLSEQRTANMAGTTDSPHRMPVYFLGIGGPNFMENTKHSAYLKLAETGVEITTKVKPKAVVVFSAHWQDSPTRISVNAAEDTDLIYDFYGFPPHYYEYKYPNKGSPEVAEEIVQKLSGASIQVEKVKRGLDHGAWVGFLAGKSMAPVLFIFLHLFVPDAVCKQLSTPRPTP